MATVCFSDGQQRASVELAGQPGDRVLEFVQGPELAACSHIYDAEASQDVTDFRAAVAAVQSGVIFASKKASVRKLQVTILRLEGFVGDEGYTGFAVAASREFLERIGVSLVLHDPDADGWSPVGCVTGPVT
jgi:hypothetical protein